MLFDSLIRRHEFLELKKIKYLRKFQKKSCKFEYKMGVTQKISTIILEKLVPKHLNQ